ncbi:Uncharacterised protein [Bordetella pertussis]|nr:Uncharacterised protein [Bordetella pertussis]
MAIAPNRAACARSFSPNASSHSAVRNTASAESG